MIMMVLTYVLSDKIVDYLLTVDPVMLKRVLNLILVVILVFIASNKKQEV
jgi:hypothetical protein